MSENEGTLIFIRMEGTVSSWKMCDDGCSESTLTDTLTDTDQRIFAINDIVEQFDGRHVIITIEDPNG